MHSFVLVVSLEVESEAQGRHIFTFIRNWQAVSQGDYTNVHIYTLLQILRSFSRYAVISLWFHFAFLNDCCWHLFLCQLNIWIASVKCALKFLYCFAFAMAFFFMSPLSVTCVANILSSAVCYLFTLSFWWKRFNYCEVFLILWLMSFFHWRYLCLSQEPWIVFF